jgi:hypothetical protein
MRNCTRLGLLIFTLLLCSPGYGQRKPKIKGNRSVTTVNKPLNAFSHLQVTDDLEVVLEPGNEEAVRIEADDNLIDILRFEQDADTLKISSFYTITGSKELNITLTYQNLETLRVERGGIVAEQPIDARAFDIHLSEGATAILAVRASEVQLHMEGNASSELNIVSDSLAARFADQSKAFIYSSEGAMDFSLTGRAAVTLEGTGTSLTLSMTDNAALKAAGMQVSGITAFLNASAQADLYALDNLAFEGRDKSKLFVYGEPKIEILGFYDTAELHKASQ